MSKVWSEGEKAYARRVARRIIKRWGRLAHVGLVCQECVCVIRDTLTEIVQALCVAARAVILELPCNVAGVVIGQYMACRLVHEWIGAELKMIDSEKRETNPA